MERLRSMRQDKREREPLFDGGRAHSLHRPRERARRDLLSRNVRRIRSGPQDRVEVVDIGSDIIRTQMLSVLVYGLALARHGCADVAA
jgi:hypothetical protein